jgi:hypothetical protein|tara:strand:- start:293 stop:556 length:264 start_codon:yes stop_codon:yes gene_type:complete
MERKSKGQGFRMKKNHTLPGINANSEGNTDMPDGRSASSAFQKQSPNKFLGMGGGLRGAVSNMSLGGGGGRRRRGVSGALGGAMNVL